MSYDRFSRFAAALQMHQSIHCRTVLKSSHQVLLVYWDRRDQLHWDSRSLACCQLPGLIYVESKLEIVNNLSIFGEKKKEL